MKAVVYSDYGGPEVLRLVDVDAPTVAANHILVRVRAAAVNPADWHLSRGVPMPIRFGRGLKRPGSLQRIGLEYSGTVAGVGRGVSRFAAGDAVFGGASGALAEYISVPAASPMMKPDSVSFEQAAGVVVAGTTALHALRDHAKVRPGQAVLINGAAGGVGTCAVQLAKILGAEVTGVQSARNLDLVRSLGADHVIDYTKDDFTAGSARYDVVLDNVGNRSLSEVRQVLKPGGVYLPNSGGSPDRNASIARILGLLAISPFISHTIKFFLANPTPADLQTLADLMHERRLTPVIDTCYALDEVAEAMRHLESGHARGKVIVRVA
jgi:NADPH:quinone reductase-like Zn-dependent oxidoreductase